MCLTSPCGPSHCVHNCDWPNSDLELNASLHLTDQSQILHCCVLPSASRALGTSYSKRIGILIWAASIDDLVDKVVSRSNRLDFFAHIMKTDSESALLTIHVWRQATRVIMVTNDKRCIQNCKRSSPQNMQKREQHANARAELLLSQLLASVHLQGHTVFAAKIATGNKFLVIITDIYFYPARLVPISKTSAAHMGSIS